MDLFESVPEAPQVVEPVKPMPKQEIGGKLVREYVLREAAAIFGHLETLGLSDKVALLNDLRSMLHELSPFKHEPVDFVRWVASGEVVANDYNPNSVAPPEMELLKLSIMADGYTQPIVTWPHDSKIEVIDGFHRHRVGKECKEVQERIQGYLPTVVIKDDRTGKADRMASTIRHNRARGKHGVSSMSEIVIELKKRNWTDAKISKELGMDADEVLRLCQISGLSEVFADEGFSEAWEAEIFADDVPDSEIRLDILAPETEEDDGPAE